MALPKLGDKVRDIVTGFKGTVISRHEYLNGCVRLSIQPNDLHEGRVIEAQTFDIEQIAVITKNQHNVMQRSGGPEKEPARRSVPTR